MSSESERSKKKGEISRYDFQASLRYTIMRRPLFLIMDQNRRRPAAVVRLLNRNEGLQPLYASSSFHSDHYSASTLIMQNSELCIRRGSIVSGHTAELYNLRVLACSAYSSASVSQCRPQRNHKSTIVGPKMRDPLISAPVIDCRMFTSLFHRQDES